MRRKDAELEATRITALDGMTAYVVRILPTSLDPIQSKDNGWDVEVTVTDENGRLAQILTGPS